MKMRALTRMKKRVGVLSLSSWILLGGAPAEARDLGPVKDRIGVTIGRVWKAPDGSLTIQDRVGVRVGSVRPLADGRVVVQDRVGVTRGTVSRQAYERMKR
jgi:hypothetical protein